MKKLLLTCMLALGLGASAQNTSATAVPITALPYASGIQTTCGSVDDYPAGSYFAGASNYGGGEDYVYSYTSTTANESVKFTLGGTATWKVLSVHSDAAPSPANAIGGISGSSGSGIVILTLPTVGTYYLFIDTWPTPNCGEFTLNVEAGPVPPNCATLSTPANASTVATTNPTLTWTAPTTGVAPTGYKVYLGTTNPPTTLVSTIATATTTYTPTAASAFGTTYYWYVKSTAGGADAAGCDANVFSFTTPPPPPAPANDDCANAVLLTVNPDYACGTVTAGTTVSATQSTGTTPTCYPSGINDDVWYKFSATATSHRISLTNIVGGTTDMIMQLYSGACGSLVAVTCSDPEIMNATGLTVGTEYIVRVWTYSSAANTRASFDICVGSPPPPPANDDCAGAVTLTVNADLNCTAKTSGYTDSATQSTDTAPTCVAAGTNDDVWYKFTATNSSQTVTLSNVVGSTNMAMAAYSGLCGSLVQVACSDPNTMSLTGLTVGQEYTVRVWTNATTATATATFDICVGTPPPPPANDDCANAIAATTPINGTPYTNTQDASSATNNGGFVSCGTESMNDGVWYTVVGDGANYTVDITNVSGGFDSAIGVYTGSCGSFTCVGSEDNGYTDGDETYTFAAALGTTYYINIGNWSGTSDNPEGAFTITITTDNTSMGTNDIVKENGVNIYPNPFTDFIRISDVKDVVSISIVDMSGRMVKTVKPANEINLSSLKAGMYLINLKMKDGSVKTVKSIKK